MDANKQALLNYLLGGGIQQEKPPSHVIRQEQTRYSEMRGARIPVPTREEIEALRRKEALKADESAAPKTFTPMEWGKLPAARQQPKAAPEPEAPPKKVSAPLWKRVRQ